jgi:hypothetical protein
LAVERPNDLPPSRCSTITANGMVDPRPGRRARNGIAAVTAATDTLKNPGGVSAAVWMLLAAPASVTTPPSPPAPLPPTAKDAAPPNPPV